VYKYGDRDGFACRGVRLWPVIREKLRGSLKRLGDSFGVFIFVSPLERLLSLTYPRGLVKLNPLELFT
jgi:hypothetical protein